MMKMCRLLGFAVFAGAILTILGACHGAPVTPNPAVDAYLDQFAKSPLRVEVVTVQAAVGQTAPDLVLQFSQPMVDFADMGLGHDKIDGISLEPNRRVSLQWVTPQTLTIQLLDRSTKVGNVAVTVAAGWESRLGFALLRPENFDVKPRVFSSQSVNPTEWSDPAFVDDPLQDQIPRTWPPVRVLWLVPPTLTVGDRARAIVRIRNDAEAPLTILANLSASGLTADIGQNLNLAPGATYDWSFELIVTEAWQKEIETQFTGGGAAALNTEIALSWQAGEQAGLSRRSLSLISRRQTESATKLGLMYTPQTQTIFARDLSTLESGEIAVLFSLKPLLTALNEPLSEDEEADFRASFSRAAPNSLLPEDAYADFDVMVAEEQMRLAVALLQKNPAHPVARQVKRSVDKNLAQDSNLPVIYWTRAFTALLLINPADSLAFEVLAEIFARDFEVLSAADRYEILQALLFYERSKGSRETAELDFAINNQTVLSPKLTARKPAQSLPLPVDKLPKDLHLSAALKSGAFAFYEVELRGFVGTNPALLTQKGAALTHLCYAADGSFVDEAFATTQTYVCHLRWVLDADVEQASIALPLLTGAQVELPPDSTVWQSQREGNLWHIKAARLPKGYYDVSYLIRPVFVGDFALPDATLLAPSASARSALPRIQVR